jgi:hypothetical protein
MLVQVGVDGSVRRGECGKRREIDVGPGAAREGQDDSASADPRRPAMAKALPVPKDLRSPATKRACPIASWTSGEWVLVNRSLGIVGRTSALRCVRRS